MRSEGWKTEGRISSALASFEWMAIKQHPQDLVGGCTMLAHPMVGVRPLTTLGRCLSCRWL